MYNAVDDTAGFFGLGWSSPLDQRLILSEENAVWVKPDGQHIIFDRQGSGYNRAQDHALWLNLQQASTVPAVLYQTAPTDNVFVLTDNAGAWWAFSPAGVWLGNGVSAGNAVTTEFNSTGEITALNHAHGRKITLEYTSLVIGGESLARVAYAQSYDASRIEYNYDEAGKLISASTAAGLRRYSYNEQNLIESVIDASGVVEVKNTYDNLGRVSEQLYPRGLIRRYSYMPGGVTYVTNADGSHANSWISDSKGRLVGMVDAHGYRQNMAYDSFNNRVSVTERDGSITTRLYDKRGRLVREVSPEGSDFTYRYDEFDRPLTAMTPSGAVVEFEYADDLERNPSAVVDAMGGRTTMTWEKGLLLSLTGATGVSMTFGYNEFGDLTRVTNHIGDTSLFERDAAGRVTASISPLGLKTLFTYDAAGMLLSRQTPDGAIWRYSYGPGGRLEKITDPTGASTLLEYDLAGEVTRTIDPLGRVLERSYDEMGNLSAVELDGARWGFEYDELMQMTKVIDPLGNHWSREYNENGQLTATVDPTGVRKSRSLDRTSGIEKISETFGSYSKTYDAYGRLKSQKDAAGSEEIYTYDAAGRVVEVLDAEGGLTRIERNLLGAITALVSPEGRRSEYTYDACGRPEKAYEPTGEIITLTYDADSRVIKRESTLTGTETYTYDAVGRMTESRAGSGALTRVSYDLCGRAVFIADNKFGQRRFAYNAAGQLTCATSGIGGKTHFTYTASGQVASRMDANGALTRFEYDAADRLIKQTDALGRVTTFTYDAAGRRRSITDAQGNHHGFTYDQAGMPCTRSLNGKKKQSISYDVHNRRISITEHTPAHPTHTLTYNRLGTLLSYESPNHHLEYTYNKDSQRTSLSIGSVRENYTYTSTGLLSSITREAVSKLNASAESSMNPKKAIEAVHYRYSPSGQLLSIVDEKEQLLYSAQTLPTVTENKVQAEELVFDGGYVQCVSRLDPASGELVQKRTYFNQQGLVIAFEDSVDGLRLFSYDDAHLLTGIQSAAGVQRFEYDQAGFLVRECAVDGLVREFSYDAAGQLVSVAGSDGVCVEFVYDGLGRRVRESDASGVVREFAFDELDQLVGYSSASAGSGVGFAYDPWGMLAGVAGVPVVFDVGVSGVPVVLALGDEVLPLGVRVAGFDVVGDRGVDAFGVCASVFSVPVDAGGLGAGCVSVGASSGVVFDSLEVLGARVYDAGSRGFLSVDPLVSPVGAGWGANVYAFAGLSPVGLVDPWGLSPMMVGEFARYREGSGRFFDGLASDARKGWELVSFGASEFLGGVRDGLGRVWEGVKSFASDAWETTVGVVSDVWDSSVEWFKDNWQFVVAGLVLGAGVVIGGPIGLGIVVGFVGSGLGEAAGQLMANDWDFSKLDPKKIANASSVGGIAGGLGAGAGGMVAKSIASAGAGTAERMTVKAALDVAGRDPMSKLVVGMYDSAVAGGVNGAGGEVFEHGFTDPNMIVRKGISGTVTGLFTPLGAAGTKAGINKSMPFFANNNFANKASTVFSDAFSGGAFGMANYGLTTNNPNWEDAAIDGVKGAVGSAVSSDPVKTPVFESSLNSVTSVSQRVSLSAVSDFAVTGNGLAADELLGDDDGK